MTDIAEGGRVSKKADMRGASVSDPPNGTLDQQRIMFYTADWRLIQEEINDDLESNSVDDRRLSYFHGIRGLDDVIMRRKTVLPGGSTSDVYYLTDAQFSVVALIKTSGTGHAEVLERVDYTAYGLARHHRGPDVSGDGGVTVTDLTMLFNNWGGWGVGDVDRSGSAEVSDQILMNDHWGAAIGAGQISTPGSGGIDNLIGYGGMVFNAEIAYLNSTGTYIARHRWYEPQFGRWLSRDPAGYVDGMLLYAYVSGNPLIMMDPLGLFGQSVCEEDRWWWEDLANGIDALFTGLSSYGSSSDARALNAKHDAMMAELVAQGKMDPNLAAAHQAQTEGYADQLQNDEIDFEQTRVEAVVAATAVVPGVAPLAATLGTASTIGNTAVDISQGQFVQAAANVVPGAGGEALAKLGTKLVPSLLRTVGDEAADGVKRGIYEFSDATAGGKPYVGQSANIPERLARHQKDGRLLDGSEATTTAVLGGKTAREIAEHQRIQQLTGGVPARHSPQVANLRDPIGPKRQSLLDIVDLD